MYICGANSFSKLFLSFWVACAECAFFSLLLSIYFECNFLVVGLCFFLFWIYCSQTVVFVGGATYTVVFSILNEVCLAFKTVHCLLGDCLCCTLNVNYFLTFLCCFYFIDVVVCCSIQPIMPPLRQDQWVFHYSAINNRII